MKILPGQVKLDLFGQSEAHAPAAYPWAGGVVFDYFAGGGGASTGLAQGLGRSPDYAINHNQLALAMHEANHPDTVHLHDDVWKVDARATVKGRPVLLLWGSPDCTHFSRSRGGKPVRKQIRGLAWVLHRFVGQAMPAILMMENVEEFTTWGPVVAARCPETGRVLKVDGTVATKGENVPFRERLQRPDPARKGQTFRMFVEQLRAKGYVVEWRILTACDYGSPTSRKRFFLIARRDGLPIVWPDPSHGDPRSLAVQAGHRQPWRTAGECIDWSIAAPSIFERSRDLAEATCKRIARGVVRYVLEAGDDAFLVCLTHGARAEGLADPMRTVTAAHRGERAIVVPSLVSIDHQSSQSGTVRPAGATLSPVTSKARHALVAAFIAKNYTGVVGSDLADPLATITATDHNSLVASSLVRMKNEGRTAWPLGEPIGCIQAQGNHWAEVRAFLVKYYGTETGGQALADPLDTITGKHRFGLATVTIGGEEWAVTDIGFRMLEPHELFRAQGFPATYQHREVIIDGKPRRLTKSEQVAACGNSVPPDVVRALVEANVPKYAAERRAA